MKSTRVREYNRLTLDKVKENNRRTIANCNFIADHLRNGNDPSFDKEVKPLFTLAARALMVLGRRVVDACNVFKGSVGFDIQPSSAIVMGKTCAVIKLQTPREELKPFEEAECFMNISVTETVKDEVPKDSWMETIVDDRREIVTNFTQSWVENDYDAPMNQVLLIYMLAYSKFPLSLIDERDLLYIQKSHQCNTKDLVDLLPTGADLGRTMYNTALYFDHPQSDKKVMALNISCYPDVVKRVHNRHFDHVEHRALIAERDKANQTM